MLGIELLAEPIEHFLMLGMLWIADGIQKVGVAPDAATILRRAGALAGRAAGQRDVRVVGQYLFEDDLMLRPIGTVSAAASSRPVQPSNSTFKAVFIVLSPQVRTAYPTDRDHRSAVVR